MHLVQLYLAVQLILKMMMATLLRKHGGKTGEELKDEGK